MNILLLKKLSASERRIFRGHRIWECPAFEIKPLASSFPKKTFDYVLVTSQNALRFARRLPNGKRWVFIGDASRKAVGEVSQPRVLSERNSSGILSFFAGQARGSLFFPRSRLGDPELVRSLRRLGFRITVRHTYETKIVDLRAKLRQVLSQAPLDSVFVTSPSSFVGIRRALKIEELRKYNWIWVAIGPTTAASLKKFKLDVKVSRQPALNSMMKTLKSAFTKRS